jgi:hypothetical protein
MPSAANDAEAKLRLGTVDTTSVTSPQERHDEGLPLLTPEQHVVMLQEREGGKTRRN